MKNVLIRMLPKQLEFLSCKADWAAAKGGVGSGKTMAMVWWMIRRLETYPEANHVVVGADYDQLRRGFFQSLVGVLEEDLGFEMGRDFSYRENPTPLVRLLHNGARLRSMSAELAQRVRSAEFQSVYCEEPQTWHNGNGADTFRAVSGRLRHSRKSSSAYADMPLQGRMTFNPPAIGSWLYDLVQKQWANRDWPCLTFSLRDNKLLPGLDDYVAQIESMYPPDRWPVEIEGDWGTFGGVVYRQYDARVHAGKAPDGLPAKELWPAPILWTHDFNVHKMCSIVCQQFTQAQISLGYQPHAQGPPREAFRNVVDGWQKRVLYAHDEIVLHDAGTPDVVAEFLKRYGDHARKHGVFLYGDPSAGRGQSISSTAAVRTAWDDIITSLRNASVPLTLRVHSASPSPGDRVNMVNAQFINRDGFGFLMDADRCADLENDFRLVAYKEGTNDLDKTTNKNITHSSDALGYLIYVERMLARNPGSIKFKFNR